MLRLDHVGRNIAIILSGGQSVRMGTPKALLKASAKHSFLAQLAARARQAGLEVLVVTGAHAKQLALAHPELEQVVNQRWRLGQWSSVRAGLRAALRRRATRVLLQPVDAPDVKVSTWRKVLAAKGVACAAWRGTPGHPVGLDAASARAALRTKAHSLAEALALLGVEHVEVTDAAVLENINAPSDMKSARRTPKRK